MSNFIKVAWWQENKNQYTSKFNNDCKIDYINIKEIYKFYEYRDAHEKFNFNKFNNSNNLNIICNPTVIITKNGETFYHPVTIKDLEISIKDENINIESRFEILDL